MHVCTLELILMASKIFQLVSQSQNLMQEELDGQQDQMR